MKLLKSQPPPSLDACNKEALLSYLKNTWELEDLLMKSIPDAETFYLNPEPLRNPLIFYLGHSAVFYINKLIRVNLLNDRLNRDYEILFELGVDPQTADELNAAIADIQWPELAKVWDYRDRAYEVIAATIEKTLFNLPIHQNHPLWALMMAIEHQRIHFETSSMIIRQLPVEKVKRPDPWQYAPSSGSSSQNDMVRVSGGWVEVGKPEKFPLYGWDNEYGCRPVEVRDFWASQYMITNAEFQEFISAGGYDNPDFWERNSWSWKTEHNVKHPKFWIPDKGGYKYRVMFDEIELPLDWPVEVNHYEAMAYCRWKGENFRLMSEAEWNLATYGTAENKTKKSFDFEVIADYNINLKLGSPSPVGFAEREETSSRLYDLRGNVWEWLNDDFNPLPGFKAHTLYEDYSNPFFDGQHKMMLGGAWVTQGTEALPYYRNWFRPNFYQHTGFRIARDL